MLPFTENEAPLVRNLLLRSREALQPDGNIAWDDNLDRDFKHAATVCADAGPAPSAFFAAKDRAMSLLKEATDLQLSYGQAVGRLVLTMEHLFRLAGECVDVQYVNIFGGKALRWRIVSVTDAGTKDDVALRFCCRSSDGETEQLPLDDLAAHIRPVAPHKSIRLLHLSDLLSEELSRFKVHRSRAQGQIRKLIADNEAVTMTMHISLDENDVILADFLTEMLREIKIAVGKPLPSYANYKGLLGSLSGCLPFSTKRRDPRLYTKEKHALLRKAAAPPPTTHSSTSAAATRLNRQQQQQPAYSSSNNTQRSNSSQATSTAELSRHKAPRNAAAAPSSAPATQNDVSLPSSQQQQRQEQQQSHYHRGSSSAHKPPAASQSQQQQQQHQSTPAAVPPSSAPSSAPASPEPRHQTSAHPCFSSLPPSASSSASFRASQSSRKVSRVVGSHAENGDSNNSHRVVSRPSPPRTLETRVSPRPTRWASPCLIDLPAAPRGWRVVFKPAGMDGKTLISWWADKDASAVSWTTPMQDAHSGVAFVANDHAVPLYINKLLVNRGLTFEFVALVDAAVCEDVEIAAPDNYRVRFSPLLDIRRKRTSSGYNSSPLVNTFVIGSITGPPDRLGVAMQHAGFPVLRIGQAERVHFFGVTAEPTVHDVDRCMRPLRHWLCPIPLAFFARWPLNAELEKCHMNIAEVAVTDWEKLDIGALPHNPTAHVGRIAQLSPFANYWNTAMQAPPHPRCWGAAALPDEPVDVLAVVRTLTRSTAIPCRSRIGWLPDYKQLKSRLVLGAPVPFPEHQPLPSVFS